MQNLTAEGIICFMFLIFVGVIGFFLGAFYKKVEKIADQLSDLKTDVRVLQSTRERQ